MMGPRNHVKYRRRAATGRSPVPFLYDHENGPPDDNGIRKEAA